MKRRVWWGSLVALAALGASGVVGAPGAERGLVADTSGSPGAPATYCVGAAKVDITPSDLAGVYLGGYGIGPMHAATSVLRRIYARAIAVGDCSGDKSGQVVIAADDLQGHFIAYQQGPYGFADMAAAVQETTGVPASNILIQSTHTHNGPDDLGIWGGVPDSYLQQVATGTEAAIEQAVAAEQPATLRWATADMTGFSSTFGPDDDASHNGDNTDYPVDDQLRVLQATSTSSGDVVATLLNYSSHATVYGPLDEISPDWPGAAATYLEGDQSGDAGTGFPGSVAVVTVGAVGHTWPAPVPAGKAAPDAPTNTEDPDNFPADTYGDAVAHQGVEALASIASNTLSGSPVVAAATSALTIVATEPALLASVLVPVPGLHAYRQDLPPYMVGDALVTEAQALRVGDLAFVSAPGEPFPSIEATLSAEIAAPVVFPFGLADDQVGYLEQLDDYNGAWQCSTTDEGLFTISPVAGNDLEAAQRANAARLGFTVDDPGTVRDLNVGPVPPPTACAVQQAQQAQPPLP